MTFIFDLYYNSKTVCCAVSTSGRTKRVAPRKDPAQVKRLLGKESRHWVASEKSHKRTTKFSRFLSKRVQCRSGTRHQQSVKVQEIVHVTGEGISNFVNNPNEFILFIYYYFFRNSDFENVKWKIKSKSKNILHDQFVFVRGTEQIHLYLTGLPPMTYLNNLTLVFMNFYIKIQRQFDNIFLNVLN